MHCRVMAEGEARSSQGLEVEPAPDMAQMFQAMARQFVLAITNLKREAPHEEECGCPFKHFE
jgi:hypothetical protein